MRFLCVKNNTIEKQVSDKISRLPAGNTASDNSEESARADILDCCTLR